MSNNYNHGKYDLKIIRDELGPSAPKAFNETEDLDHRPREGRQHDGKKETKTLTKGYE